MSKPIYEPVVGRIAFGVDVNADGQPIARTVRVIKANPDRLAAERQRRHALGLLRELIKGYPVEAMELVGELVVK